MLSVKSIELTEVGPREGFQYEGIDNPQKISTHSKVQLVEALSKTGLKRIEVTSFVSPRWVPQMADAEILSELFAPSSNVCYTAIFLNRKGFLRAKATGKYDIEGVLRLSASETFGLKNHHRSIQEDIEEQRSQLGLYREFGLPLERACINAAFGCNYEGRVPLELVLSRIEVLVNMAENSGQTLRKVELADTMGWADPEQIKRTITAVRQNWPQLEIALHLHDTRGTGIANVYAAMEEGVRHFDTSIGGLGGCPFAGVVAGNVATEDVVFMCERMGVETGVDLEMLIKCARLAERIVGHALPSKMAHIS